MKNAKLNGTSTSIDLEAKVQPLEDEAETDSLVEGEHRATVEAFGSRENGNDSPHASCGTCWRTVICYALLGIVVLVSSRELLNGTNILEKLFAGESSKHERDSVDLPDMNKTEIITMEDFYDEDNNEEEGDDDDDDTDIEHSNLIDNVDNDDTVQTEAEQTNLKDANATTTTASSDDNEKCIPKACHIVKHFISAQQAKKLTDPPPYISLVSFPGSGNTWVRSIIEAGTRIWTGSVYGKDEELYNAGFHGEGVDPWLRGYPTMSAIKTHYPYYHVDISAQTRAVVYILRSPFNAFLAELVREYSSGHVGSISRSLVRHYMNEFLTQKRLRWTKSCEIFAGKRFWNNTAALENEGANLTRTTHGVTSVFSERRVFRRLPRFANITIPVLTLFYEDFVADFEGTSRILLTFLKGLLKDAMPTIEDAVQCALLARQQEQAMHRKSDLGDYNPYIDPSGSILKNGVLEESCRVFESCWFEEKWGRCEDARRSFEKKVTPARRFSGRTCP